MATHPLRPLAEGNRFQRRYAAWAAPHYARMPEEAREAAELLDRFLYSRRGLGVWLGMACAVVGSSIGLTQAGMPWLLAALLSAVFWGAVPLSILSAWLLPHRVLAKARSARAWAVFVVLAGVSPLLGFMVGHVARRGALEPGELLAALGRSLSTLAPAVLLACLGLGGLMWGVARIRRGILQQELERAALAREAAEARLKLLQGQIQPHFIFNTLSALQHWVDTGDARAGALLRSLTAFLRGSTELLARDDTTLADEAAMVGHYLAIQQARVGERLRSAIDIAPDVAGHTLPPGLLLTLVENAVEHGLAPALSGGTVRVRAWSEPGRWQLSVKDDGVGLAREWRDGTGLANSRERLRHRFGDRARLELQPAAKGTQVLLTVEDAP
jgi:signal transduction histidine kinase